MSKTIEYDLTDDGVSYNGCDPKTLFSGSISNDLGLTFMSQFTGATAADYATELRRLLAMPASKVSEHDCVLLIARVEPRERRLRLADIFRDGILTLAEVLRALERDQVTIDLRTGKLLI